MREKANYSVLRMARLLGVARSGFYAWIKNRRVTGVRAQARARLDVQVRAAHQASGGVYGAPRVTAQLRREGVGVDKKTVARSLARQGLAGVSPRVFVRTTVPGSGSGCFPDRVKRCWDLGGLDRVWISDITYLRTGQGWLYLCVVRDGHSRRVIGWAIEETQTTGLVAEALAMAIKTRGDRVPDDLVFHADRGAQYTSGALFDICQAHGIKQSVGRTGVCWDNAMAESFWATLKTEFYDRKHWPTKTRAKQAVGEWIEKTYNRRRLHSALGYLAPATYELQQDRPQLAQAA